MRGPRVKECITGSQEKTPASVALGGRFPAQAREVAPPSVALYQGGIRCSLDLTNLHRFEIPAAREHGVDWLSRQDFFCASQLPGLIFPAQELIGALFANGRALRQHLFSGRPIDLYAQLFEGETPQPRVLQPGRSFPGSYEDVARLVWLLGFPSTRRA